MRETGSSLHRCHAQADAGNCNLVAHSADYGHVYEDGLFTCDDGRRMSPEAVRRSRDLVPYTAVAVGEGRRSGIDRNCDGIPDSVSDHRH